MRYLELIARWRRRARLTAVSDPREAARIHVADALLCLRVGIPAASSVVDVGSGAGLPGIPLAVIRDDLRVTLLDADRRKVAFLEAAVRDLGLASVHVAMLTAEDAARTAMREAFDLAVARALAPLDVSWELTLPLVSVGGRAVLLKGPSVQAELARGQAVATALGGGDQAWSEWVLRGGERRIIVTVTKLRPTPARFPRRPGVPRRRPIKG